MSKYNFFKIPDHTSNQVHTFVLVNTTAIFQKVPICDK
jgi:hypothetical protein